MHAQQPTYRLGRTIWIARHGNRADFVDPAWAETAARPHDPGLSPDGVAQARQLGRRLAGEGIEHIFASPFLRTVETAAYVAEALGLSVNVEHGLCEWLNPTWFKTAPEFLSAQELAAPFARVDTTYSSRVGAHYPENDEQKDCWPRAGRAARLLATEFAGDMLCVCHGASMTGLIYGLVEGFPAINCGLCSLAKVVWNGTAWGLELNGDQSHLSVAEPWLREGTA
ncbi:MAG: histidine phosphatase family protein [Planctomycetota bacterium]|nr:histidine phosphatase family protein [Planctomycetota bacterium]